MTTKLSQDVRQHILLPFLDIKSAVSFMRINREHVSTLAKKVHQIAKKKIEEKYADQLIDLFKKCEKPIHLLPQLTLMENSYIDSITPDRVQFPVMRFTDCLNRSGILLKIRGYSKRKVLYGGKSVNGLSQVLIIYNQQQSKSEKKHRREWSHANFIIEASYKQIHFIDARHYINIRCPTCPFLGLKTDATRIAGIHKQLIINLLTNNDSDFRLMRIGEN